MQMSNVGAQLSGGTINDRTCPARRPARAHVGRILLSRTRTAGDRAAGMALEDGGRKEMLFQGRQAPPRENLIWSYEAKQIDLDKGATVRGRRHYTPQELKAIAAVERQTRNDDEQPTKRKKLR